LLAPGTLSHITSHHTLPLPLQRHPTDETPIILPEPLPRAFLVCRVPTFRQDHRPFFLPILRETDRTLGDPHAEEGQLQLDFALRGGPPGVDVDQPGEKGGYCFGPGSRRLCGTEETSYLREALLSQCQRRIRPTSHASTQIGRQHHSPRTPSPTLPGGRPGRPDRYIRQEP
jgi:hypothetical protein